MQRTVDLTITDIAFGGSGVGRFEGKAVFVPFTIDGEELTARILREKKSFAQAEIVSLTKSSEERVEPPCPYFGSCGGCVYQHMRYQHQLHWKARQVEQALRRIGKFADPPMRPIVPSPREYAYRNRITVHVDGGVIGFFRHNEHSLVDVERCPISQPAVNEQLAALRARRPRDGHYTLRASRGPRVFSQTNDEVAALLGDAIAGMVPADQSLVVDAYCGAGFFARRLIDRARRIVGIDWDIHAIAAAQENASATENYIAGEIATHLREQLAGTDRALTTVIVDPPATGLNGEIRDILSQHPVGTLLYVSCNPPTMARDLAELGGVYRVETVTPFDMFPQTAEIEVLAQLTPEGKT